jgi:sporulation protein YlmC with PRC-barrel domain
MLDRTMTRHLEVAVGRDARPVGSLAWRPRWILVGATVAALGTLAVGAPAHAQVAGSTSIGVSVIEATRLTMGWSVKKGILGKTVYNDSGDKVGTVEDLIISPDRTVSYLIVGAGGFVGIGRHDVAIPVTQVKDTGGRLIIPGATKAIVEAMPRFDYADDSGRRDQLRADADHEITAAKVAVSGLEKKAAAATADAKVRIDSQVVGLQKDVKTVEEKVAEMNRAASNHWHEFEVGLNAATTRLHKAVEALRG